MKKPFNWKVFWILTAAAAWGLIAIVPYSLALQANSPALKQLTIPLPLLVTLQLAPQVIMFALLIALGLLLAGRIGLGLPILDAALRGEDVRAPLRRMLPISIALGVLCSLLLIVLDLWVFAPALHAQFGSLAPGSTLTAQPAAWKGLLASFYGGIDEELLLRLFAMSLLAWLGHFISHRPDGTPTTPVFWIANVLAAVLFGLGHLPGTAAVMPITPLVVLRAVVLNGLIGVAFGYLYMKHGLEAAIVSHFSADIVLHVLFPLLRAL